MTDAPPRPPQRPPYHHDAVYGDDFIATPEYTLAALAHRLSGVLEFDGPWTLGDWHVVATRTGKSDGSGPFEAGFRATRDPGGETVDVALHIAVHASGWLEARLTLGSGQQHAFFIERVYEEFDIWPPLSPCTADEAGRMGKRCSWVQLKAEFWPELAGFADGGFITVDRNDVDR